MRTKGKEQTVTTEPDGKKEKKYLSRESKVLFIN